MIDSLGESLLVYHQKPFEPLRRVHLGGGPYAIAFDRGRWGLWITLNANNQLVNYAAGIRPVIRDTLPSIRDARSVLVDGDHVTVSSQDERQILRRAANRARPEIANSAADDEQPAGRVAVPLEAAHARVGAGALAADRRPEHEQQQQREARRARARS